MKKSNIIRAYNYFVSNKGKAIRGYELEAVHLGSTCFFLYFTKEDTMIKLFVTSTYVDREVIKAEGKSCGDAILKDSRIYRSHKTLGGLIESMIDYETDLTADVLDLGINWD